MKLCLVCDKPLSCGLKYCQIFRLDSLGNILPELTPAELPKWARSKLGGDSNDTE